MRRTLFCAAAGLVCILLIGKAEGTLVTYNFTFDNLYGSFPNAHPATGSALATLDSGTDALSRNISFSGLAGTQIAAHFQSATMGVSESLVLPLAAGTVDPIVGSATVTSSQAADIMAGLQNVDIHPTYPGGEIRQQVTPEPATVAVLGLGGLLLNIPRK